MTGHNPSEGDIVERLMQDRLLNPDYATRREAAAEITRLRELLALTTPSPAGGDAELPCDSGMSGDAVERAEMFSNQEEKK